MTTQEFSDQFDVLYNNIMSNQAPGLDEYEKSVFLTKAQYEIIKNYFNPKSNKNQEGFDDSPKRQIDFSNLMVAAKPTVATPSGYIKFDSRSALYELPSDILFALNETALIAEGLKTRLITIVPISFEEYARILSKPYKQPLKNQGWRILNGGLSTSGEPPVTTLNRISEIIVKAGAVLSDYTIRYVRRPKPIILATLTATNVSLEGETDVTECELDCMLHPEILQRAVELAKNAYGGDLKSTVDLGQRSE